MHTMKRFAVPILAAMLAVAAGCAGTESQKSTGEYIDDAAITAKVKTALIRDDSLNANSINVETFKGTVQLSGFVEDREDIGAAEDVASGIDGVVNVRNDLRVKGSQ